MVPVAPAVPLGEGQVVRHLDLVVQPPAATGGAHPVAAEVPGAEGTAATSGPTPGSPTLAELEELGVVDSPDPISRIEVVRPFESSAGWATRRRLNGWKGRWDPPDPEGNRGEASSDQDATVRR
jgi:hypothetical protein